MAPRLIRTGQARYPYALDDGTGRRLVLLTEDEVLGMDEFWPAARAELTEGGGR